MPKILIVDRQITKIIPAKQGSSGASLCVSETRGGIVPKSNLFYGSRFICNLSFDDPEQRKNDKSPRKCHDAACGLLFFFANQTNILPGGLRRVVGWV